MIHNQPIAEQFAVWWKRPFRQWEIFRGGLDRITAHRIMRVAKAETRTAKFQVRKA